MASPALPCAASGNPPSVVVVANRQRDRRVDGRRLREFTLAVLAELGREGEIGIRLVSARAMARVNWRFLQHQGSTDVITFDHGSTPGRLHGELYISVSDAVRQAVGFKTSWTGELARYVIHGLLHLCGYDDLEPVARRKMKREENRLIRCLSRRLPSALLEPAPRPAGRRHG